MSLRVFVCTNFHSPEAPWADAVIIALDPEDAARRLELVLEDQGLPQPRHWAPEFTELSLDRPAVLITNERPMLCPA